MFAHLTVNSYVKLYMVMLSPRTKMSDFCHLIQERLNSMSQMLVDRDNTIVHHFNGLKTRSPVPYTGSAKGPDVSLFTFCTLAQYRENINYGEILKTKRP